MTAEILPIETRSQFDEAVRRSAEWLKAGQLVALPTETVYGLAANALDVEAVRRIYEAKGRPAENPIIVHVGSLEMARRCVNAWPSSAVKLASAFWPGPLTIVLPRAQEIPPLVTAGGETVGVRWPSHPFMQAVIRACGFPLAAPSANPSNELSPTTAQHVFKGLGDKIQLIVDGGPCQVGIESTVVDLASAPPRMLRPGMISVEAIEAILGKGEVQIGGAGKGVLRSPGQLQRHYSPKARLAVMSWNQEAELVEQASALGVALEKIHVIAHNRIPFRQTFGRVAVIPSDAEAFARALYAEMHRCDEGGAEWIIVEKPPAGEQWNAISDRLRRAVHRA